MCVAFVDSGRSLSLSQNRLYDVGEPIGVGRVFEMDVSLFDGGTHKVFRSFLFFDFLWVI